MGAKNSSTTRVAPVFDSLFARDPSGATWLPRVLGLGSRAAGVTASFQQGHLVARHPPTWGRNELALPAPLSLLEYLIQNITPEQVASGGDAGMTLMKRQALAGRDPGTTAEALRALRKPRADHPGRAWYILEGASRPDATFEMADSVLVIEGKRTERTCTSRTKWMPSRSQLVRHMDAARDCFPTKQILGLLLVEGTAQVDTTPSEHWQRECAAQYSAEMLLKSLPHRSPEDRQRLAQNILGVATWQRLCAQTGLPWPPRHEAH